ncbi:hypothetical protein P7K49_026113, partial [Saguinus oedipus]
DHRLAFSHSLVPILLHYPGGNVMTEVLCVAPVALSGVATTTRHQGFIPGPRWLCQAWPPPPGAKASFLAPDGSVRRGHHHRAPRLHSWPPMAPSGVATTTGHQGFIPGPRWLRQAWPPPPGTKASFLAPDGSVRRGGCFFFRFMPLAPNFSDSRTNSYSLSTAPGRQKFTNCISE